MYDSFPRVYNSLLSEQANVLFPAQVSGLEFHIQTRDLCNIRRTLDIHKAS